MAPGQNKNAASFDIMENPEKENLLLIVGV
jgi:hypothetical protein